MTNLSKQLLCSILFTFALVVFATVLAAESKHVPVDYVARSTLRITTSAGTGLLPIYVSADLTKPQPHVTRVIVIFHGKGRNAENYFRSTNDAVEAAGKAGRGTIVIAPQFLIEEDADAHHLESAFLRWHQERWESGQNAERPAAISSFDAIDALLAPLADRSRFPGLAQVVLAGHSGGGQILQRYAVVGRGEAALTKVGIRVRYVIANPSSYVYFSEDRPLSAGGFAPYTGSCQNFNRWKYGLQDPPPYVGQASIADMEESYSRRDVIYLLGTADTDPHHPDLDVTCAGETEGPYRLARGTAYFAYIKARHAQGFSQRLWEVPGVAHDERRMFHSSCGMEALFDIPGCASAKP